MLRLVFSISCKLFPATNKSIYSFGKRKILYVRQTLLCELIWFWIFNVWLLRGNLKMWRILIREMSYISGDTWGAGAVFVTGEGDRPGRERLAQNGSGPQEDPDHSALLQDHGARSPTGQTVRGNVRLLELRWVSSLTIHQWHGLTAVEPLITKSMLFKSCKQQTQADNELTFHFQKPDSVLSDVHI